jgi:hypothetical protein
MISSKQTQRSLIAAAFTLVFASAAMAAEGGAGDKGANNMNPGANNTKSTDTRMNTGADIRASASPSTQARATAKQNYNTALTNCKSMSGAERSTCRKEAKMTRDQAYRDAKTASAPAPSSGMSTSSSSSMSSAPGAVPPGGRAEQRAAGKQP